MRVVRHLLRRVELEAPVGVPVGHDSVGFGEPVVDTQHRPRTVGGGVGRVHERTVAELLEDTLLNVGASQVVLASPVDGFAMVLTKGDEGKAGPWLSTEDQTKVRRLIAELIDPAAGVTFRGNNDVEGCNNEFADFDYVMKR